MRTALACAGFAGALAVQSSAQAQVSAGLAITSDYRVRGVSFSNRRPALSVSLADDLPNGAYFGATAIVQDITESDIRAVGDVEYLGYARRLANGVTWEAGLDRQHYDSYGGVRVRLNYADAYIGLSKGAFSTRFYYSPNYNGDGHSMAYLETNAAIRPADGWRVTGHVGVQQALNSWHGASMKPRYDGRVDIVRSFGRAEVSVGVAQASPDFAAAPKRSHAGVIVGAAVYF